MLIYKIKKISPFFLQDAEWNTHPWKDLASARLMNHMGEKPDHFPETCVKLVYDDEFIYLMFQVKDRYVKAVAASHQDDVYKDSCVEFFFTPGSDISKGYFNLEINCGGTMLFHFQKQPRKNRVIVPDSDCDKILCIPSLPKIINPEIAAPVTWHVACKIPFSLLEQYCPTDLPGKDIIWKANFYKCADATSHPHWLTWSLVDFPRPDFHRPQDFGSLQFEE